MDRCRECGDVKPLDAVGKCRWRAGCEHRQMVHEARMGQLNAELARAERNFTASPLLYAMAEWQRECYEHIEQLMVDGETFIDGQRYFLAPRQHVNPIESPLRAIYESFEPDED